MATVEAFLEIKSELEARGVTLVAVSKYRPDEAIMERYEAGQRIFAENRPQELAAKYERLPKDIEWHLIGHLQTNKVKMILPFVALIHSGDRMKLLRKLSVEAERIGRDVEVLLQAKVAVEETKHGFSPSELEEESLLREIASLPGIRISGLMGMASLTDDRDQVRAEFRRLRRLYDTIQASNIFGEAFRFLSMGMSSDYRIAIEEGANMVRIGSLIF